MADNAKVLSRHNDIVKSPNDPRLYRGLILKNEMKVLIVSDPNTDKSAASINVSVGYMSDPDEIPGLAHFCEHLLFMGTIKYPKINDYMEFLSLNAGYCNAFTNDGNTNYHFEVNTENLRGALDRLAQFFICPLFLDTTTEKELNAVHHEFEMDLKSDLWRIDQLDRFTSDPKHPYSKFGIGNKDTLEKIPKEKNINVREKLLEFHDKWYSANLMSLSVIGKEDLDDLEKMVLELFSDVGNKEVIMPTWPSHPYREEDLRYKIYILPETEFRNMTIVFPIPDYQENFRAAPVQYWVHLLDHEGHGSIHKYLKDKGWINSVSGSNSGQYRGFDFFRIMFDLTIEGLNYVDDILLLAFQYLNMIKKEQPLERIFEEYKNIAYIDHRFREKGEPVHLVTAMAENLPEYPIEELFTGPNLYTEWNPELISAVGQYLVPEKMRIVLVAKEFEERNLDCIEPYFGTQFKKEPVPTELLKTCQDAGFNEAFHFPKKNPFIPTIFDIKTQNEVNKYPIIIKNTQLMRMWFKQDDQFLVPRAYFDINFDCPLARVDPLNLILTELYTELVIDSLNELVYEAGLGGISWSLFSNFEGFTLSFSGYDEKMYDLLEQILDRCLNLEIDVKRFNILKEEYFISFKNIEHEIPEYHAQYQMNLLLSPVNHCSHKELIDCESFVIVERLKEFIPQLLGRSYAEGFLHGNTTVSEALKIAQAVESFLTSIKNHIPVQPALLLPERRLKLPEASQFSYEIKNKYHETTCTHIYYQVGIATMENDMLLGLFVQIASEPCFNILRSEEQLGYIVQCFDNQTDNGTGLSICLQGNESPVHLEQRIDEFLESMKGYLKSMKDADFKQHTESLATNILEKPKELSSLYGFFSAEITTQRYTFDRKEAEVKYLRTITKKQMIDFYKKHFKKDSNHYSKLIVYVTPEKGTEVLKSGTGVTKIEDILKFRASLEVFPVEKSRSDIPRKGVVMDKDDY